MYLKIPIENNKIKKYKVFSKMLISQNQAESVVDEIWDLEFRILSL